MSETTKSRVRISSTRNLPFPNPYVKMLLGEYSPWAFDEERAPKNRGEWRSQIFQVAGDKPMDLEIGPGNGYHFSHYAEAHPDRCLVGLELKYKPLIQSIRRALKAGCENARIMRFNAKSIDLVFSPQELDNVFIHFPDPWPRERNWKNRLVATDFLQLLFDLQRPGSLVEFKTDSLDYFEWSLPQIEKSAYEIEGMTKDLHNSVFNETNFRTSFEKIFANQGTPINFIRLRRP